MDGYRGSEKELLGEIERGDTAVDGIWGMTSKN